MEVCKCCGRALSVRSRITLADVAEIRRLRSEGVPAKEIAKKFGVHDTIVGRYSKDVPGRTKRGCTTSRIGSEQITEARIMRAGGMKYREIASALGLKLGTIWRHSYDVSPVRAR